MFIDIINLINGTGISDKILFRIAVITEFHVLVNMY